MIKRLLLQSINRGYTLSYSDLTKFLTKRQARLVLDCLSSSSTEEIDLFICGLNDKLEKRLSNIILGGKKE